MQHSYNEGNHRGLLRLGLFKISELFLRYRRIKLDYASFFRWDHMRPLDCEKLLVFHILEVYFKLLRIESDRIFSIVPLLVVFNQQRVLDWVLPIWLNWLEARIAYGIFVEAEGL